MSDDIIKKYEKINSFVATEEDLRSLTEEKTNQNSKSPEVNISPILFEEKSVVQAPQTNNELNTDYQYIRSNLYSITERSVEALNNLVQIADQSQHPRAYEVIAFLVNSIASAQKDLMTIHREKAKIEGIVTKNSPEIINNNLFVGNTAQLDEIIKNMTKKPENE